jgi:hypothetical protein
MTKLEILKKNLDMASHNLYCTSANYLMTRPKEGMETEWTEYQQEVKLLTEMIKEQESKAGKGAATVTVSYYQLVERFAPLEFCSEEVMDTAPDPEILERMWCKYNADDRPDGRAHRSMSMGDVVSIDGRAYFCDRVGWSRL